MSNAYRLPRILPEAEEEKHSHTHPEQANKVDKKLGLLPCQDGSLILADVVIDLVRPSVDSSAQIRNLAEAVLLKEFDSLLHRVGPILQTATISSRAFNSLKRFES